jgi:peptide/nickel transport system permease protein
MTAGALDATMLAAAGPPSTRRRRRVPLRLLIPATLVLAWIVATGIGPMLLPFSPTRSDLYVRLRPPSAAHWLGTDEFGRDVLTRVLVGGRVSLQVGLSVVVLAASAGTAIGLCAGYFRGARGVLMRINDAVMSFPAVMLAIAVIAVIGAGQWQTAGVLAVVYTPLFVRVVYGETLSLSKRKFVQATALIGASRWRILWRHVFPNLSSAIIVQASYVFATAILLEASLSFLGAGVQPPTPSWGGMINAGYPLMAVAWWIVVFPGVALATLVLALSLAGDALSDLLGRGADEAAE